MNRNFYCINILALLVFLSVQALASDSPSDFSTTANDESGNSVSDIVTPDIDVTVETTTVYVWFNMQSEGNNIEIYRSTSSTTGFQLVATVPDTQGSYADRNLKGRTTFYYKARAINGSQISPFSDVENITTYADYYPPAVTAQALDPYTVEITFTDNSYYDQSYEVHGKTDESLGYDFSHYFAMTDSGRTIKITHTGATPGTTYKYDVLTWPNQYDAPTMEAREIATATTPQASNELTTPDIDVTVETTTVFVWFNIQSEGNNLEIYRSTSPTSGFQLIATVPDTQGYYADRNLKGRTTFYYKARAVNGSQTSAFSEVEHITTYANYYRPTVTAKALDAYTIEITFTDNSYYDQSYELFAPGQPGEFDYQNSFQMADSGRTVKFIHYPVTPGATYNYDALIWPQQYDAATIQEENIATVTTPRAQTCSATGSIERERWDNVSGYGINLIPVNTNPSSITTLTSFSSPVNEADNYGARVRGFVCAPETGDYVFWITSDDNSELWLSTNELPANRRLIASSKWTGFNGDWARYATQQSAPVRLEAGKKYYIEALHKESAGRDHLAVGWKLPSGALERPIPGSRLSKYPRSGQVHPNVAITNPKDGDEFTAPASFKITANASDPDGGTIQYVEFSSNGNILSRDTQAPYEHSIANLQPGTYTLQADAKDDQGLLRSHSITIRVNAPPQCAATGKINRELWTGISGTNLSVIPFDSPPSAVQTYSSFETIQRWDDNYGSRMRGYVCVPISGNYTFWISSDDKSQLYLSTDDNPANKRLIASVDGYTGFRIYDKYASQKSGLINLVAGQKYYIEAIHKEAAGNDFISVGWQLPNGTLERPIGGNRLIDFGAVATNQQPTVRITSPASGTNYPSVPADVKVTATATDTDGTISKVEFYLNDQLYNTDTQAPYEYTFQDLPEGGYRIHAHSYDNSNTPSLWSFVTIQVGETNAACADAGKIYWEVWSGIPGYNISDIPVNEKPRQFIELEDFETPSYHGDDYGARVRGYICPPRTGAYTFHIASDDASELWLSPDDDPANKTKIAYLLTATQPRNWNTTRVGQHSAQINLVAGTKYYIEALHKEARGGDHLSVAWRFVADGTFEGPIPGSRLIPYEIPDPSASMTARTAKDGTEEAIMSEEESSEISVYPNPTSSREISISLGNLQPVADPRVEIISSAGRIIQSQTASCEGCNEIHFTLDNNVVPGLYLVNVVMNRRRITKKLQVK